jgi:biotin carboxyl carrier protein
MGCRLEGPHIAHRDSADILSDWVPKGGIQVPGDGRPIVLLADRQTTGGYAKIAIVIGPDVGLVAQCKPGDTLRFRMVSLAEAQAASRALEAALAALPEGLVQVEDWTYAAGMGEVPGRIPTLRLDRAAEAARATDIRGGHEAVRSPMAALVAKVLVTSGEVVAAGQPLLLLQAMKMEHEVVAPRAGRITRVSAREGDSLGVGDLLATIEVGA